jgi:hypothetical protein
MMTTTLPLPLAADVEDNERRRRQPIYTIINLSSRRW